MTAALHLASLVERAAEVAPRDESIVEAGVSECWRETAGAVEGLAGRLAAAGVLPGDRVALIGDNSGDLIRALFAIARVGAIAAPLNTRLTLAEMGAQLRDADARLLLADSRHASLAAQLAAEGAVPALFALGAAVDLQPLPEGPGAEPTERDAEAVVCLLYTGGTTGRPKGVMHSSRSLVMNAFQSGAILGRTERMRFVHVAPLFHIGAVAYAVAVTLHAGTHLPLPQFDPSRLFDTIGESAATHVTLVPTMLARLLDHPGLETARLGSLRRVIYGASPIPEVLLRRAIEAWPHVEFGQSYGQTETVTITMLPAERHVLEGPLAGKLRTAGQVVPGAEVRIRDPEGRPVPRGELGEIEVRSASLMTGYWRQPEATAATLVDGFVRTGDIGWMDEEGFVSVVDRMKDIIISGGENIYSVEVEDALARHPDVESCAVIGAADPVWGEIVHAVVRLRPGRSLEPDDLTAHARRHLAGYKVPRRVTFLAEPLPLSGAGKVLKRELRAMLAGNER
ncbi:MAG: class I adenylate-forming enzyme family protein [Sphingomonadaceae bacterium]